MSSPESSSIAILGGTGPEGSGLALRWARAGRPVILGSRSSDRAQAKAQELESLVGVNTISGAGNEDAAAHAGVVVIAVPYDAINGLRELRPALDGKPVISVVAAVRFGPEGVRPIQSPAGSVALELAGLLPESRVASAFHTLSAEKLGDLDQELHEDTLVFGEEREDRQIATELAGALGGVHAISGGRLINSYYAEQLVGMLATLNRIHKAHSGIRIVDLKRA